MTISGAYGRDYKNKQLILQDWLGGKDFIVRDVFSGSGTYINKSQAEQINSNYISVRYKQDRSVAILKKNGDSWSI